MARLLDVNAVQQATSRCSLIDVRRWRRVDPHCGIRKREAGTRLARARPLFGTEWAIDGRCRSCSPSAGRCRRVYSCSLSDLWGEVSLRLALVRANLRLAIPAESPRSALHIGPDHPRAGAHPATPKAAVREPDRPRGKRENKKKGGLGPLLLLQTTGEGTRLGHGGPRRCIRQDSTVSSCADR